MSYSYPIPPPSIRPRPSKVHEMKYHVFINFRGEDTREKIVSHIKIALDRKGVLAFCDTDMASGKDITPTVLKAIGKSLVSLVIFSENYAYSPWCLEELVRIMECKKIKEQKVVTVFYNVNPSDVENLTGTFGKALAAHEKNPKYKERVYAWKSALKEAASIAGFDSKGIRPDTELVHNIVKEIDRRINKEYVDAEITPPRNGYPTSPYMDPPVNGYPIAPYMGYYDLQPTDVSSIGYVNPAPPWYTSTYVPPSPSDMYSYRPYHI